MLITWRSALLAALPALAGLGTAVLLVLGVVLAPALSLTTAGCSGTPKPLSPAEEEAVVVAEDLCEEIAEGSDEAWVKLLCKIGGGIAHYVIVPRPQWAAVKTLHVRSSDWKTSRAAKKPSNAGSTDAGAGSGG